MRVETSAATLHALLDDRAGRAALEAQLPAFVLGQRWFGGRTRDLTSARLTDWAPLGAAALCVAHVEDASGGATDHLLVLEAARHDTGLDVHDGLETAEGRGALLAVLAEGSPIEHEGFVVRPRSFAAIPEACHGPSRLLGAEQSNSSVVYDDRCVLKLYRRLRHGRNPEVELSAYLSGAGVETIPAVFAAATIDTAAGLRADAALLQAFVPNRGDGWAWALARAGHAFADVRDPDGLEGWLDSERNTLRGAEELGRITAQLHAVLAAATEPDLTPALFEESDARELAATVRSEFADSLAVASAAGVDLGASSAALVLPEGESLGLRTRVHGDFHLGQVLDAERGFTVVDFEGEPARSIEERRRLQHPFTDVAGMLRSWSYAAHVAARSAERAALDVVAAWEAAVRARYLTAYWDEAARAPVAFVPHEPLAAEQLLHLFELRKALYEVRYELDNRPGWVEIPAAAVRALVGGGRS